MINFYEKLIKDYPVISIEDAMSEDDWDGWKKLTTSIGGKCQLVGDDLFVTNEKRFLKGINADIANPVSEGISYDGTRAIDGGEGKFREGIKSGGKAKKYRCFVTKENSKNFPELTKFINELCSI